MHLLRDINMKLQNQPKYDERLYLINLPSRYPFSQATTVALVD